MTEQMPVWLRVQLRLAAREGWTPHPIVGSGRFAVQQRWAAKGRLLQLPAGPRHSGGGRQDGAAQ